MAREWIEKPEINVGDRVYVNHPVSGFASASPFSIVSKDDCHWYLVPFNDGMWYLNNEPIRVRLDAVRLNLW